MCEQQCVVDIVALIDIVVLMYSTACTCPLIINPKSPHHQPQVTTSHAQPHSLSLAFGREEPLPLPFSAVQTITICPAADPEDRVVCPVWSLTASAPEVAAEEGEVPDTEPMLPPAMLNDDHGAHDDAFFLDLVFVTVWFL